MLKAGITGGIGSGKTTVCQVFETLGIPVFYADLETRNLVNTDPSVRADIQSLFGADIYQDGLLDRRKVASIVFADKHKLEQLNAITHPAAIAAAERWLQQQTTPYALKEAALFFETGSHKNMDVMIGVYAPLEVRISRVMAREHTSRQEVLDRINRQMEEDDKMRQCDFVIVNDGQQAVITQVLALHQQLLEKASNK